MTAFAKTIPVLDTSKPSIKQKGYSIIELSIALAIISIILVTALAGVQRILRSNNVNEDLKNINLVASKLAVMLSSVPNTAGTCPKPPDSLSPQETTKRPTLVLIGTCHLSPVGTRQERQKT
jgi:prepilin-type N-terminal cleavage/methylation domain-containing protein